MASSVRLEIITPSKKFYQGDVELVIVRTLEGDEGFMKGHAWACKLLDIGEMWIQEKGAAKNSYKVAAIAGGFIGASLNKKSSEAAVEKAFNAVQLLVLAISIFNIVRNLAA